MKHRPILKSPLLQPAILVDSNSIPYTGFSSLALLFKYTATIQNEDIQYVLEEDYLNKFGQTPYYIQNVLTKKLDFKHVRYNIFHQFQGQTHKHLSFKELIDFLGYRRLDGVENYVMNDYDNFLYPKWRAKLSPIFITIYSQIFSKLDKDTVFDWKSGLEWHKPYPPFEHFKKNYKTLDI